MNINIAILDDEQLHIDKMKEIIEKCIGDRIVTVDEYMHQKELLESHKQYDIILVDMELNETGRNDEGLDFVKDYRKKGKDALMIFVTNHDELARDGYKVKAFGYVYKEKIKKELPEVFIEAIKEMDDNTVVSFSALREKGIGRMEYKKEILIKEIKYFETEKRHIRIHLETESFLINSSMNRLFDILKDDRFCIVQKSYVVNMEYLIM